MHWQDIYLIAKEALFGLGQTCLVSDQVRVWVCLTQLSDSTNTNSVSNSLEEHMPEAVKASQKVSPFQGSSVLHRPNCQNFIQKLLALRDLRALWNHFDTWPMSSKQPQYWKDSICKYYPLTEATLFIVDCVWANQSTGAKSLPTWISYLLRSERVIEPGKLLSKWLFSRQQSQTEGEHSTLWEEE